jgi:5'(3')-deoxyribonucleotidase
MIERIIIDMDGVIADFVKGWRKLKALDHTPINTIYDMCAHHGIDETEFWKDIDQDFWANLPKTPEADELISMITVKYHASMICITSKGPVPGGEEGKFRWIRHHYPYLSAHVMFGYGRHFFANKKALLIDDCEDNVTLFRSYGGNAVLLPRPWNNGRRDWQSSIKRWLA